MGADVARAVRNALTLGLSLCGTWAIALAVRIILPRHLGPEAFGGYQFADAFTTVVLVVTGLGLETYIRKEVPTRPAHANDFFGGATILRLALGVVVLALCVAGVRLGGKSALVATLVALLGAAQLLLQTNVIFGALLHAAGTVGGLSLLNVAGKLVWGGGIVAALFTTGDVRLVALAVVGAETLRTVGMAILARRHLALRWRVDVASTRAVVRASLPFYVAVVAGAVYGGIDTTIMSFLTPDVEVGWFGATSTLVGLSLLLAPLIGWVLLPLLSRAAARSTEELLVVGRRGTELILTLAFPITLLLGLHAELAIHTAFGDAYAPAARALRIEAPLFVFTYAAMVASTVLVRLERSWAVTWVQIGGMVLSPTLNVLLVPWAYHRYGAGGAGIGAAITLMITELATTGTLFVLLGRQAIDRRLATMLVKTVCVCVAVVAVHAALRTAGPFGDGTWRAAWARLVADAAVYAALAFTTGAVDVRAAREMLRRRQDEPATAAA